MTLAVNFATPAAVHVGMRFGRWILLMGRGLPTCRRLCCRSGTGPLGTFTQNQLNEKFLTGEWHMETAYAELLTNVFCLLVYASGIPFLLWVGTIGFTFKVRPLVRSRLSLFL